MCRDLRGEKNRKLDLNLQKIMPVVFKCFIERPGPLLHKTMVTSRLVVTLQSMVTIIDFLALIGYGAALLW